MIYKSGRFSLLEMIIALGMISIAGIFILQMFLASDKLNARAGDMDTASFIAMSTLEELKASYDPNRLFNTEFVEGSQVAFGQGTFFVIDERMEFASFEFWNGFRLYKYYDANWQPAHLQIVEDEPSAPQNEDAVFKLALYLTPLEGEGDTAIIGLVSVSIYVWDLRNVGGPIVDFSTKLYFPQVGELI